MTTADPAHSTIIDVGAIAAAVPERWHNRTLTRVNSCLVRMGVFEGEFHWHHHDREDEFFFVVSGQLLLDVPTGTVELGPGQGYTVPAMIEHRTRARERTVVLMVEGDTVAPRGD